MWTFKRTSRRNTIVGNMARRRAPANLISTLRISCFNKSGFQRNPCAHHQQLHNSLRLDKCGESIFVRSETLESERPAELLNNEEVPIHVNSIRNARIVYFHTKDNPYNSWQATKNQLKGSSRDEILTRAYGVLQKPAGTVFRNLMTRS